MASKSGLSSSPNVTRLLISHNANTQATYRTLQSTMRSNVFTALVVLAAASGSSMVTGTPIPRGSDLSSRFAFEVPDSSRFGMDFVKRSPANGGDGRSSNTGNVNAGDIVNSGDNIQNGPGASKSNSSRSKFHYTDMQFKTLL